MTTWNAGEERLLKQWANMCKAYSWMHQQAEQRTGGLKYILLVPILVANAIAASVSFVSLQNDCESTRGKSLEAVAAIVNIIAGGLVVLDSTMNLSEIKEKHHECASLFARIGRLIQSELSVPRKQRFMDGYNFLRMVSSDVDRIITMNIPIPAAIQKKFDEGVRLEDPFEVFLPSSPDEDVEIIIDNDVTPTPVLTVITPS